MDKEKLLKVINIQQTSTYWFHNKGDLESSQILLETSRILQMSLHATLIRPRSFVKLFNQGWAHAKGWSNRRIALFTFASFFSLKTAGAFCILPFPAYPAHSAGFAWQEENMVLNAFSHCIYFFSPVFSSCWFAKSQVTELWAVCPTGPLFWSVLQHKLEKPVRVLPFFFVFDLPLPLAAAACTHADEVVPTFHVERRLTKTEVASSIIPELF